LRSLIGDGSGEVKRLGGESTDIDPSFPVHSGKDSVDFLGFKILFNPQFPGFTKLNGGDGLEEIHFDVVLSELLEHFVTNKRLEISQKLEAFFVRNLTKGVIGVVVAENGVKRTVRVGRAESTDVTGKRGVTKLSFHKGEISSILDGRNLALNKDGPAFVKPEVLPVLASDCISSPAVGHLVSSDVDLRLVSNDNSGRSKSQKGVFHTAHGERRREDNDGVVTPDVLSNIVFSKVQKLIHFGKFIGNVINLRGLRDNTSASSSALVNDISNGKGHKVRGNRNLTVESGNLVGSIKILNRGLVSAHLSSKSDGSLYGSRVSDAVSRSILEGCNSAAVNVLALGEKVRVNLARSLTRLHPAKSLGIGVCGVVNTDRCNITSF